MLEQCTVFRTDGREVWTDNFLGSTLGSVWATASWMSNPPGVSGDLASVSAATGATGAVRTALSNFDATADYQLEMYIVPFQADHHGKYQFFLRMDDTTPAATTNGVVVELVLESAVGALSGTVKSYNSSALVDSFTFSDPGTDTAALGGWFKVLISTNTITVYWRGYTVLAANTLTEVAAGKRFGFGINCTQAGGTCLVDTFRIQYKDSSTGSRIQHTYLLASSNGSVYKDNLLGQMVAISSSLALNTDRLLHGCERGGKLYVADTGSVLASGTDGVRGTGNTKFDSATYADWTTLGLDTNNLFLEITSATSNLINGVYQISTVAAGELTLSSACASASGGTGTFRIIRGVKVVDPAASTIVLHVAESTAYGTPLGHPLIALWRDRLVHAGDPDNPGLWIMSAQGNIDNYDTSATGAQRAIAGSNADAGRVGEPILAMAPHSDDYLIFGCTNSIWVMAGDPAVGGTLDARSRTIGVASSAAWCFGPSGEFVFWSRDGMYVMAAGAGGTPTSVSREKMPQELLNLDPTKHTVQLEYDVADRGVHIMVTPNDAGTTQRHFWFDWETRGFWPLTLTSTSEPTAMTRFVSEVAHETGVILGGRDGYLRSFSDLWESDDGTAFSSNCFIGPINMGGGDYYEGILSEVYMTTDTSSGDVDIAVHVGNSAEAAKDSTAFATYEFNTAGLNHKHRPRARGQALYLNVKNGESRRNWAVESIGGVIVRKGKRRLV
jgi:hypothetical protein